jgi:hypothetical protein
MLQQHNILKKGLLVVSTCLSLTLIGYIGYADIFKDKVAAAEQVVSSKAKSTKPSSKGYYGVRRAEIAIKEYRKGVAESTVGCNCGPEVDVYTEGLHSQWCTMFASWVAKEAGSPLYNQKAKSWKTLNSQDFAANLKENGTWYSREEILKNGLEPEIGDYLIYWRGGQDESLGHVDIVVEPSEKTGHTGTIGGNLNARIKYRKLAFKDNYGLLGFGRPEKP